MLFINYFLSFKGAVDSCQTCHGSGMYVRLNRIAPGMVQQIQTVCRDCGGQGERISGKTVIQFQLCVFTLYHLHRFGQIRVCTSVSKLLAVFKLAT